MAREKQPCKILPSEASERGDVDTKHMVLNLFGQSGISPGLRQPLIIRAAVGQAPKF